MKKIIRLSREYVIGVISFTLTTLITITSIILSFSNETSFLIFFIGATISLTSTLIVKELETKLENQVGQTIDLYRVIKSIDDPELQLEITKLATNISRGNIPPFIAAIRSTKLFDKTQRAVLASDYNPNAKDILRWDGPRLSAWHNSGIEAIKRGVSVERIFILNKEEVIRASNSNQALWDKDTLRILTQQQSDGVKIRILWIEDVMAGEVHPQRDVLRNVVIFDEREVVATTQQPRLYRLPSDRVQEFLEIYEEQKKYSITFEKALKDYQPLNTNSNDQTKQG